MQNKTPNKEHDKIFKIALENRKELVEIINEILRLRGKEKIKKILKNKKNTKKYEGGRKYASSSRNDEKRSRKRKKVRL